MNLILLISLLVGGFFVNVASIPGWIRWLHYLSLFFYAYASLITNEVANLSMDFVVSQHDASLLLAAGVDILSTMCQGAHMLGYEGMACIDSG